MNQLQEETEPSTPPVFKFYFYRIHCKDIDVHDSYIGRTMKFESRVSYHKLKSNDSDLKLYKCISENGGFDNWICECVHTEMCTETASSFIEYALFKLFNPTLNIQIPRIKLNVLQSKRVNYNRTACKANYAIQKDCECGWSGSKMSYAHHLKSKKHHLWVSEHDLNTLVLKNALQEMGCVN